VKVGDQVTVEGYPAKDGSKMASARKITLADGGTVFSGTSPTEVQRNNKSVREPLIRGAAPWRASLRALSGHVPG